MCWGCWVFSHVVGTTDMHAAERRAHTYAARCQQCGQSLDASTHVAAHVLAYPCMNGCCGFVTLRTTCRACNSRHRLGAPEDAAARRWFCGVGVRLRRLSSCICHPICAGAYVMRQ